MVDCLGKSPGMILALSNPARHRLGIGRQVTILGRRPLMDSKDCPMIITTEFVDLPVDGSPMRLFVASPKAEGRYPGVVFYSDIFQLTPPMLRITRRLAGYGFTVVAPEIYHRIEPPGTVLDFEGDRARALDDSTKIPTVQFDIDIQAALDFLNEHPKVAPGQRLAAGFCFGGHLAFRAALLPDIKATTCFYGTGIHNGNLGCDTADSLDRAGEIQGKLLMVFGTLDPHIPEEGRALIDSALKASGVDYEIKLYSSEHTFMRDEGARYDPEATDQAFAAMIDLFRGCLN
jgi:carboxymethylenebutenolidase